MKYVKFLVKRARKQRFHPAKIPEYPGLKKKELQEMLDELKAEQLVHQSKLEEFDLLSEDIQDLVKQHGPYADAVGALDLIWRKERGVRLALGNGNGNGDDNGNGNGEDKIDDNGNDKVKVDRGEKKNLS